MSTKAALRLLRRVGTLVAAPLLVAPAFALAGGARLVTFDARPSPADHVLVASRDFYARTLARDADALLRIDPPARGAPAAIARNAGRVAPAFFTIQGKPVGGYVWALRAE